MSPSWALETLERTVSLEHLVDDTVWVEGVIKEDGAGFEATSHGEEEEGAGDA